MREDEFEKRVREKMEQLGFEPSESVWAGVDKEISKGKKRRVPFFWLIFVSGLLLAGGAYYFIANKNSAGAIPAMNAENGIAKIPKQKIISEKKIGQTALPSTKLKENNAEKKNAKTGETDEQPHVAGASSINQTTVVHTRGLRSGKNTPGAKQTVESNETNKAGLSSAAAGAADIVVNNYNSRSAKTDIEKDKKKIPDSATGKIIATTTQNKSKKDSAAGTKTAKINEQKKQSSAWKIGYTAGLGSSNLNQNLFNSVNTLSPVSLATNTPTPTVSGGNSSSEISPGFSFNAGAFVNRNLSKRLVFSAGVDYHYYSTSIRTGMKINTALVTYNSRYQMITSTSYYENGNSQTFTNQYHFIELPLSVNFQIIKSKNTPFIWELGVTPGYIVSSNALYYDPNTNVYFSKYLQPNKMQINGTTALMIGFPLYKGELQVGPQIQYGFTGFVNTNDGNSGHLFYAGLKISFIPGKK